MYRLKSYPEILNDLVAKLLSETALNDVRAGSALMTLLEGVAEEDAQQYIAMLDIIQSFNLDTTSGNDLDERALEYGLSRLGPVAATGYVQFSDSNIIKYSSKLYSGSSSPIAGQTSIDVENNIDMLSFAATGSVIVGRGTVNVEKVAYIAMVDHGEYWTLTLGAGISNNHGTEETVILAQGGDRTISEGTEVYVPSTDLSAEVPFITTISTTILDGENESSDVLVKCTATGSGGNVSLNSIIKFRSAPFSTAEVTNNEAFANGRDNETDQELRDRIRSTVQSLSRGTAATVTSKIARITDGIKTVLSSTYVEATSLDQPSYIYIDDGTGFEPTIVNQGYEEIMAEAAGTEKFFVLDNFPVVKASLVTINSEPYELAAAQTLIVDAGGVAETLIFSDTAFNNIATARAEEVAAFINDNSSLIEARTTESRSKVIIQAKQQTNAYIKVVGGTANSILGFKAGQYIYTCNLYRNDRLLSKDGQAAFIVTDLSGPFNLTTGTTLTIQLDNVTANTITITFVDSDPIIIDNGGIANLSAAGVAAVINAQSIGLSARDTTEQTIEIESLRGPYEESAIQITGGSAFAKFFTGGPPTTNYVGQRRDYILNRYNGQIELEDTLVALDTLTAGTFYTRAQLQCASPEPYTISSGLEVALVLAESLRTNLDNHAADIQAHQDAFGVPTPDNINFPLTSPTAIDLPSLIILITEILVQYQLHEDDAQLVGPFYHTATEAAGPYDLASLVPPTTYLECVTRLNDIKTQYNLHTSDAAAHHAPLRHMETNSDATDAQTLVVGVDGTANQTHKFTISGNYTAQDVADMINESDLIGVTGFVRNSGGDNYLCIRTNSWEESYGVIFVDSSSTATALDFVLDTIEYNQSPTYGYSVSGNGSPYNIGRDQNLIIVLDDDNVDRSYNLTLQVAGTITSGIDESHFRASALSVYNVTDFFKDFILQFDSNTTTALLRNLRRPVNSFIHASGTIDIVPSAEPDISNYTVAQAATIVDPVIVFTENGTTGGQFKTASVAGISVGDIIDIVDNDSEPLSCYISHIYGPVGGNYTITVKSHNNDLPAIPTVGDTFKLIPQTQTNIVKLLNNTVFASLSVFADIEALRYGDYWQLTTKTAGSDGKVHVVSGTADDINYAFLSDGTSSGSFTLNSSTGLSVGLPVIIENDSGVLAGYPIITSILGAASPYTITINTLPDITAYLVADTAEIVTPNILWTGNGTATGTFEVGYLGGLAGAILLANELKADTNAHAADAAQHTTAIDNVNYPIATADAVDLTTLIALTTSLINAYEPHDDDAQLGGGWAYHAAQALADYSLASVIAPLTLADCVARLNDLKDKYNQHTNDTTAQILHPYQ